MRQVADDGQDPVVVRRAPSCSTMLPQRRQNSAIRSTASGSVPGGGVEQAPAAFEQGGEAGVGAGIFGAGERVGGDEVHALPARSGPTSRMTRDLGAADVGEDGAGLEVRGDGGGDPGIGADRGAEDDAIGAAHGVGGVRLEAVGDAEFARRGPASSGLLSWATISAASVRCSMAERAIELPIRPMPITASRRNSGSGMRGLDRSGDEVAEHFGHQRAFLGGADGDAQALAAGRRRRAGGR